MRALAVGCATGRAASIATERLLVCACRGLVERGISVRHPGLAAARADGWSATRLGLAESSILVLAAAGHQHRVSPLTRVLLTRLAARIREGRAPRAAAVITVDDDLDAARRLNADLSGWLRGLGVMVPDRARIWRRCGAGSDVAGPATRPQRLAMRNAARVMAAELLLALNAAALGGIADGTAPLSGRGSAAGPANDSANDSAADSRPGAEPGFGAGPRVNPPAAPVTEPPLPGR